MSVLWTETPVQGEPAPYIPPKEITRQIYALQKEGTKSHRRLQGRLDHNYDSYTRSNGHENKRARCLKSIKMSRGQFSIFWFESVDFDPKVDKNIDL